MYRADTVGYAGMLISVVRESSTHNVDIRMRGRALPGEQANLLAIFGYKSTSELWFAGVDVTGDVSLYSVRRGPGLVIGRMVNGLPRVEAHDVLTPEPEAGKIYDLMVSVVEASGSVMITLIVDEVSVLPYYTTAVQLKDGAVGAGAYAAGIELEHFGIGECG